MAWRGCGVLTCDVPRCAAVTRACDTYEQKSDDGTPNPYGNPASDQCISDTSVGAAERKSKAVMGAVPACGLFVTSAPPRKNTTIDQLLALSPNCHLNHIKRRHRSRRTASDSATA